MNPASAAFLFADAGQAAEGVSWWGAGTMTVVGGLIMAVVGNWASKINSNTKLQDSNTKLQGRIDDQGERINKQQDQIFTLQAESRTHIQAAHDCEVRERELKAEVARSIVRIAHLEKQTGIGPGDPYVGIVIADLKGKIKVFSPTLTPLFQYLPGEVIGKSITLLMPDDLAGPAFTKFEEFVKAGAASFDPTRVILSYGLKKSGVRFPIALTLDGFRDDGSGFVTATIREREVGPLIGEAKT